MERTILTFAYGSNLDKAQMNQRCPDLTKAPTIEPVIGTLEGYRLGFTRYSQRRRGGVADVLEDATSEVWGLIYQITTSDLRSLDRSEGYPTAYTRRQQVIQTANGFVEDVWVYMVVAKEDFVAPTSDYLGIIKRAAFDLDFPAAYRAFLETIRVKNPD